MATASRRGRPRKTEEGAYTYVRLYMPGHPLADKVSMVLEHRLVLSVKLGRWLCPDEFTNHLNGNRRDNRPENLILTRNGEHQAKFHKKYPDGPCVVCGEPAKQRIRQMCRHCYYCATFISKKIPCRVYERQSGKSCSCGSPAFSRGLCRPCYMRSYFSNLKRQRKLVAAGGAS